MNRDRLLGQMKKEKLEHMKELGRGGLTKGLIFLRNSANTALSHASSGAAAELEDAPTPTSASANASAGAGAGAGNRMAYDDLVALSMKLTRQNKLMKAQLQRLQQQAGASSVERKYEVLRAFVCDIVGVDVDACQNETPARATDDASAATAESETDAATEPALDVERLRERYDLVQQLQQQAMRRQVEQLTEQLVQARRGGADAPGDALLPTVPAYDSIDLLSDPLPPAAPTATSAVSNLQQQLNEALEQVRRGQQALDASASEAEQVRVRFDTWRQQQAAKEDEWKQQRMDLVQQVEELVAKNESLQTAQESSTQQMEAFERQVQLLQLELVEKEAKQRELLERIETRATAAESALHDQQGKDGGDDDGSTTSTVSEVVEVKAAPSDDGDTAKLLQELQQVCVERAELKQQLQRTEANLARVERSLGDAQNQLEQNATVIDVLRNETSRLADERVQMEAENASVSSEMVALKQRLARLQSSKDGLEEQLQVLRRDTSSNLDSVVTELEDSKKKLVEGQEQAKAKAAALEKELEVAQQRCLELETLLADKDLQNQRIAKSQSALTRETMELQAQVAAMQDDLQMAAEGLEAHATRAEECELQRREADEKRMVLQQQLDLLRDQHLSDLELLRREKENELDHVKQERRIASTKLSQAEAEKEALASQIAALEAKCEQEKQHALDMETRNSQLTAELGNLSVDLAETKKALSDRMAMATRLQTENMTYAEKQAEQAARVESALRDVAASRQAQSEMSARMNEALQRMREMEKQRDAAVARMEDLVEQGAHEKERVEVEVAKAEQQFDLALQAEKDAFQRELERIEADSKQKSKLALHAVLEKEAEIARLSQRLAEVEEDVRSGDADNRKIFEFAQLQASREMETRLNAAKIQELTTALQQAKAQIQQLQDAHSRHGEEVTALMQTQRRDGVNMEYLKNVIVQFMSFKPGSSQQLRLIPVISTLLEFTGADIKAIKKASRRSTSWTSWGAESPEFKHVAASHTAGRHRRSQHSSASSSTNIVMTPEVAGATSRLSSFTVPEDGESAADGLHAAKRADF